MTVPALQQQDTSAAVLEKVVIGGDLSKLTAQERMQYYKHTCDSLGLNPLTRPFEYMQLQGKLTLYARKDATEQLRRIHGISIVSLDTKIQDGVYIVTCKAKDTNGREDIATGVIAIGNLKGDALANAMMKAETKAKRRVTLSLAGMGFTDESEIETIPNAKIVTEEQLEIAPPRAALIADIKQAKTIDELKDAYMYAVRVHAGNLDAMTDITALKDECKKELESQPLDISTAKTIADLPETATYEGVLEPCAE